MPKVELKKHPFKAVGFKGFIDVVLLAHLQVLSECCRTEALSSSWDCPSESRSSGAPKRWLSCLGWAQSST